MPSRKKGTEQRLAKQKRKEWDAMLIKAEQAMPQLDKLFKAAFNSRLDAGIMKITSDFKIVGACWDAVNDKLKEIHDMLDVVRGPDRNRIREHLGTVYPEQILPEKLQLVNRMSDHLKSYVDFFYGPHSEAIYLSFHHKWMFECEPHAVLVQSHWRRLLVLPWRRRRDIMQRLSDEASDVVDKLISDPWLTDHVYVEGVLDERRIVDLAGIVSERGAATARAKVMRRICASCGRRHAVVREKAFPVCSCGGPHYCSVACQAAHWPTHKRLCGKDEVKWAERPFTPRFCFTTPDGHVIDLLEIAERHRQQEADAADAAVAAAVAAAAMRALSPGVVSD